MKKPNLTAWEKNLEIKAVRRARKKKPVMKVSGASVKKLQKIIIARQKKRDV